MDDEADKRPLWEAIEGPIPCVPLSNPEDSVSWAFRLRHLEGPWESLLFVRVTWRGYDSIEEVPSELTKQAHASEGRLALERILKWGHCPDEVIFHSQSQHLNVSGKGSVRPELIRLDEPK